MQSISLSNFTAKTRRLELSMSFDINSKISKTFNFDLEKFPPTSKCIFKHIQRAYYQCYMGVNAESNASVFLDPLCYGYYLDDEKLVSDLTSLELSVAFALPCTCQK